jgi:hypothetical protein
MRKKTKIGDICEILTPKGIAYIQYTHYEEGLGELVRILPGLYQARPHDFATIAQQRELYFTFYALRYALRDGLTVVVSNEPVPEWAQTPLMRWRGGTDRSGKVLAWKIFKASDRLTLETHRRIPLVHTLTAEQEKLSIHSLWPHSVMVQKISSGWTPERDEQMRLEYCALAQKITIRETSPHQLQAAAKSMRHYLYFRKKSSANKAANRLREDDFLVSVRMGADKENWLALATKALPTDSDEMDNVRDKMEQLADELGGEYDGWDMQTGEDQVVH